MDSVDSRGWERKRMLPVWASEERLVSCAFGGFRVDAGEELPAGQEDSNPCKNNLGKQDKKGCSSASSLWGCRRLDKMTWGLGGGGGFVLSLLPPSRGLSVWLLS